MHVTPLGPPGQVAAVAGKKAGMKQGELAGILKDLGYTEDQVRVSICSCVRALKLIVTIALQVFKF